MRDDNHHFNYASFNYIDVFFDKILFYVFNVDLSVEDNWDVLDNANSFYVLIKVVFNYIVDFVTFYYQHKIHHYNNNYAY